MQSVCIHNMLYLNIFPKIFLLRPWKNYRSPQNLGFFFSKFRDFSPPPPKKICIYCIYKLHILKLNFSHSEESPRVFRNSAIYVTWQDVCKTKIASVKADSKAGLRQKNKYLESRPNSGVYVMGSQILWKKSCH